MLAIVVVLHGLLGFFFFPYYLTYYNPLAGGSLTAPHVLFVGWGEGLDQAAEWLNAQPDAQNQRTVAWYHDGPLSYFYDGQAEAISAGSPMLWLDTDYAVVYANQRQRDIPSAEAVAYFDALEPVHTVSFRGLALAQIYDMRNRPLPGFINIRKEAAADFGGKIRLAAYDFDETIVQPGDEVQATFYLQAIGPMETNYNVLVRLISPDGSELWRDEGWPWGALTADWPLREIRPDGHTIAIPEDAEPGLYKLVLGFYDPETFEPLPVTSVGGEGALHPSDRDVALIQVGDGETSNAESQWQFGDFFGLDATVPETVQPGEPLALQLHWQSLAAAAEDYKVFVHVVGPDGAVVVQADRRPLGGFAPTFIWQEGQRVEDGYAIALPGELTPGEYSIHAGMYTPEQGRSPVLEDGQVIGDFVVAGTFSME